MNSTTEHADHLKYWADVDPRLSAFVRSQFDKPLDQALLEALALYSFVTEDFKAKVTKKQEHVDQLAAPLILTQDILRGLIAGERELSPVTLAALARIALEVHVNLRFITKGPDPAKYADRYSRYGEVEKLIHDRRRGPSEPFMVSPALEAAIRSKCP